MRAMAARRAGGSNSERSNTFDTEIVSEDSLHSAELQSMPIGDDSAKP